MHRATSLEISVRRHELLREAEQHRWAATIRRSSRRPSRLARAVGLLASAVH